MATARLKGRVVLITGASAGIGKAAALAFARVGARVALIARRGDQLEMITSEIVAMGAEAAFFVADVAREDQAEAAAAWAEATFGAVDILVNNAGVIRPGAVATADSQDWRDTFDINVLAPMTLARAVIPGMQARGWGHIVNMSSNAAKLSGSANNAAYSASKHAISALSNSLRGEVAAHGIRVTVIEPGATETDIASTISHAETRAQMEAHLHRDGVMQADDVAAAIIYAVSQPDRVNVNEIWLTPTR